MRILFLALEFPYPPDSGGRIKTLSILDYLRRSHDVSVLCFRRRQLSADQERWAADTGRVQSIPLSRGRSPMNLARSYLDGVPLSIERNRDARMRDAVARAARGASFDAVFADGWLMAQYLPPGFSGLKLLHEHNAEYVMWRRHAAAERNPLRWPLVQLEYRRVRRYEASILPRFDTIFAVSAADRQSLIAIGAPPARTRVLPNLPDSVLLERPALRFDDTEMLALYFGTLSWQPNIEGLSYLLRSVWPLVRTRLGQARLIIAGRDAPPWLERLARITPGVDFLGPAAGAEPLYRRARVFVEATRSGGGTKLKVLNAMARGLPAATTPQAIEGIDAVPGVHLLTGDDAESLASAVVSLMRDPGTWGIISESSRLLIGSRYTADAAYGPLDQALSRAAAHA